MKDKGFIIDIIPLTRLPLNRQQHFSYVWDTEIPVGSLVSIPLFRRDVEGIVINNRSDFERFGNIKLKKVNEILEEKFLDDKQLALARFISEYYLCPLGIVLKFFVPKRTKQRPEKQISKNKQIARNIELTKEQKIAIDKITKEKNNKYYLFGPASSGKTEVYIHSILETIKNNPNAQFLILLPELTLTPQAVERYGQYFRPDEIVVLQSKVSKGKLYSAWQKIRSGEAKIIIGTRMAVFAPFQNLKLIVIDEEQDISFKQWDMSPRYDARKVAEKLAEFHDAKIILGSATPSVESFFRTQNKKYELLELPKLKIPGQTMPDTKMELVDMRKERWKKNTSIISQKLKGEIAYALKNKLQTILFINRQGMSAFSVCAKCKTLLACHQCDRALVYDENGTYHCLHCNYRTGAFVKCPKCQEMVFKNIGVGTQKVEREIQKIFPGARIRRADFASMKKAGEQEKIYREFADGKFDILIGTQMITKGWDLPGVALIGIIDADSLLAIPDFKTDEKAFQNIVQVAGRTSRLGGKFTGTVVIQAYHPENFVIRTAAELDYQKFFTKELEDRKVLRYPPFSQLISLTYQDFDKAKGKNESAVIFEKINQLSNKNVSISAPQEPLANKIRGRFKNKIIIKIAGTELVIPEKISTILKSLGTGWIIDVDPISIS